MLGNNPKILSFVYLSVLWVCLSCSSKSDTASLSSSKGGSGSVSPYAINCSDPGRIPRCGDGCVDRGAPYNEQCDGGSLNGRCCDIHCQIKPAQVLCDFSTNTMCSGSSADCSKTTLPAGVGYYSENALHRKCP